MTWAIKASAHWVKRIGLRRRLIGAFGTLFDMAPAEPIRYPKRTAAEALRSDWLRIGADLRIVVRRYDATTETEPK